MSLVDTIDTKRNILKKLKPEDFNRKRYFFANIFLITSILISMKYSSLLLFIVLFIFYIYIVYKCINWKKYEINN